MFTTRNFTVPKAYLKSQLCILILISKFTNLYYFFFQFFVVSSEYLTRNIWGLKSFHLILIFKILTIRSVSALNEKSSKHCFKNKWTVSLAKKSQFCLANIHDDQGRCNCNISKVKRNQQVRLHIFRNVIRGRS